MIIEFSYVPDKKNQNVLQSFKILPYFFKDLSRVKPSFESVPPQFHFEIAGLASAQKWRKIQNMTEEERF